MQDSSQFDLREAVRHITEQRLKRVVCQFPDPLLPLSAAVSQRLAVMIRHRVEECKESRADDEADETKDRNSVNDVGARSVSTVPSAPTANEETLSITVDSSAATYPNTSITTTSSCTPLENTNNVTSPSSSSSTCDCDIFIVADSTFGSSVDDISAAHVEADLLLYFGSDMSGAGGMDVMIVPPMKPVNTKQCSEALLEALVASENSSERESLPSPTKNLLIVFDPCYVHAADDISSCLEENGVGLVRGVLPPTLGIANSWVPLKARKDVCVRGQPSEQVGGVYFAVQDLEETSTVLYVGEKEEQLSSLLLRLPRHRIVKFSPQDAQAQPIESFQGDTTRIFRERYGGVARVKDAKVIGLLVGSMGIETSNLQSIVKQMKQLISASGKKSYCFVMGRINEAKLCNFPEVDLYCLISNDDNAIVPPKSFHVPVITPFELELGLEARPWSSSYITSYTSLNAMTTLSGDESDFNNRLQRVLEARSNRSDCESDDSGSVDESYKHYSAVYGSAETANDATQALTLHHSSDKSTSNKIIAFESPAAEFLLNRDYQGLLPAAEEGKSTKIVHGQYGTASSYKSISDDH